MDSKGLTFQVRSRRKEVLGTYTSKEIIKRIVAGRYSGEEEVAVAPFETWQKMSTHTDFYDAFIRRLLGSEMAQPPAPMPDAGSSIRSENHSRSANRRRKDGTRSKSQKADPQRTRRLSQDPKEFGATVHQSVIDELFADASGHSPDEPQYDERPEPVGATDLIKLEQDVRDGLDQAPEPTQRMEPLPEISLGEPAPQTPPEPKRSKSRPPLVYGAVAMLLLVLLFQFGGSKTDTLTDKNEKAGGVRQFLQNSLTKEEQVSALLEEGNLLRVSDTPPHYSGALEAYREAQAVDGNNAKVLGKMAEAMARLLGTEFDAESLPVDIKAAIAQGRASDPHLSDFYRVEGLVALHQGKLDEARDLVTNALDADPTSAVNALVMGEVSFQRGELGDAKRFLAEGVRVAPQELRGHYLLARVAAELGELPLARASALEAIKINPFHPPSYLLLGDIASQQGNADEAKSLYETAGRLARFANRNVAARAYFRLGQILEQAGDAATSKNRYLLAYHYDPKVDDTIDAKISGLDSSAAKLEVLVQEEEYDPNYFRDQGDEFLRQGKPNESVRFFQAAYLLQPNDAKAIIRYGEAMEKVADSFADYKRVMNVFQRAIDKDSTEVRGLTRLALLETEQYNLDRALTLLRAAENISGEDFDVYVAMGKHYYKRKDYNESLSYFLRAAKINPKDSETLYYAGLLRLMFKKDKAKDPGTDAIRFFEGAYTLNPENYDALVEWLKLKVSNFEKNFAIKFVRNLMTEDPRNANLYWALGEVYAANKEHRRAIQFYHQGLDLNNKSGKLRMALARSLEAVGDLPKATAEYRFASLLDRRNSDGFYQAAFLLVQMRDYDSAEKVLKYLISVTPNYPGVHRELSKVYEETRRKELALEAMEREVKNNPENVKFTIELAQLYMKYEMYQKAVDELKKISNLPSIAKAPEFVYDKIRGYLLLSRSYRALNKPESAEAAISLAVEIDENDPELQRELGYVYYSLQRDKESVRAFEKYLSRSPAAADAATIKGLINKMRIEQ
jgi:tetratricopeptide (TPR) repeat protein